MNQNLAMIVAVDRNGCIGKADSLPWHIPEELQYFRNMTTNKAVIMGSRTYLSIGKPLPNRENIILTTNPNQFRNDGEKVILNTIDSVLLHETDKEKVVIGGASLYEQFLPYITHLYLTEVDLAVEEGDAYFPRYGFDFDKETIHFKDYPTIQGKVISKTGKVSESTGIPYNLYTIAIHHTDHVAY